MPACRSCGAAVLWVKLVPRGSTAPLDAEPSTAGNIRMLGERNAVAKVLSKAEIAVARGEGEQLYTSHFATCPNSKQHRKPKEPTP